MSDKPLIQQRLATDLSSLILTIPSPSPASPTLDLPMEFIAGFWECIIREWSGLDRIRYAPLSGPQPRLPAHADPSLAPTPHPDRLIQDGQVLPPHPPIYPRDAPPPRPKRVGCFPGGEAGAGVECSGRGVDVSVAGDQGWEGW